MIGLGRMGANMVRRLLKAGHQCVVFDTSAKALTELTQLKATGSLSLAEFAQKLSKPRTVWLMVPPAAVDETITAVLPRLERGDILIDGGNSYYVDDISRTKELSLSGNSNRSRAERSVVKNMHVCATSGWILDGLQRLRLTREAGSNGRDRFS